MREIKQTQRAPVLVSAFLIQISGDEARLTPPTPARAMKKARFE
ncbi:hypothetical protein [Paraburkholderia saeva]|nr:hypothetical protein [Paraburkholderia saeva]